MSNLYQRIGEAMTSQGKITLVLALDEEESALLRNANFVSRGFVDINGSIVEVFDANKTVVHTTLPQPNDWWTKPSPSTSPFTTTPWTTTGIRSPYTATFTPEGSPVSPNKFNGTVSNVLNAAHDPLSILEDYYFTDKPKSRSVLNIEVDTNADVAEIRKMIDTYQQIESDKK